MSYERALEIWKDRAVDPPPLHQIERLRRFGADVRSPAGKTAAMARWGLRLAMLGFVLMAVVDNVWRPMDSGRTFAVILPVALLLVADRKVAARSLDAQMLVRAIAWSNLVIGVLVSVWGFREFVVAGVPIALGSGAALLALGGRGLGISSGSFRPLAFRMQLLIALVMAMADAETLLFSGLVEATCVRIPELRWDILLMFVLNTLTTPAIAAGLVMGVAVWGLLRMRTWALLLNLVANLAIARLALGGSLDVTLPVAGALATTAVLQLLLVVPILAAALGDRNPDRPPLRSWGPRVARWTIMLAMISATAGAFIPDRVGLDVWRVGWTSRTYRTKVRGLRSYEPPRQRARGVYGRRSSTGAEGGDR